MAEKSFSLLHTDQTRKACILLRKLLILLMFLKGIYIRQMVGKNQTRVERVQKLLLLTFTTAVLSRARPIPFRINCLSQEYDLHSDEMQCSVFDVRYTRSLINDP